MTLLYQRFQITTLSVKIHGLINDKFEAVARRKLAAYPCEILGVAVCDGDSEMLNTAGVSSQPGNMTMLAYLNDTALVEVPGAAVVMPATVFDVLLPQIFTGSEIYA